MGNGGAEWAAERSTCRKEKPGAMPTAAMDVLGPRPATLGAPAFRVPGVALPDAPCNKHPQSKEKELLSQKSWWQRPEPP